MTDAPSFPDYDTMMNSEWIKGIRESFDNDIFPRECIRCKVSEESNQNSIRHDAILFDNEQTKSDYLIADVMMDNICNSACVMCSEYVSTKYGSLLKKDYVIFDNKDNLNKIPLDRVVQFDLTGGEPSYSKNVKQLITNLPPNVKSLRINTNGSAFMDELIPLIKQGLKINITFSLDGIGKIQEYIRWPIKWDRFYSVVNQYKDLQKQFPDNVRLEFWTTVSSLNINDFHNIKSFSEEMNIPLAYSPIEYPIQLNIKYKNNYTLKAKENPELNDLFQMAIDIDNQQMLDNFIKIQDYLKKVTISDYIPKS